MSVLKGKKKKKKTPSTEEVDISFFVFFKKIHVHSEEKILTCNIALQLG
jgi:hypothetical protein